MHTVERLAGHPIAAVGKGLGVAKIPDVLTHDAALAANVGGRAEVAGRPRLTHTYAIANREARAHGLASSRARKSATRASISSWSSTPFSTRLAVIDAIQRS